MPIHTINKETQVCISLAARPSNFGTFFHNYLYRHHQLNFIYKAFATEDLIGAIAGIKALGIRGCSLSMPFKERVIPLLDELDWSAKQAGSVNTIVNVDSKLKGYSTDFLAMQELLPTLPLEKDVRILLHGSGGVARAILAALVHCGYTNVQLYGRNLAALQTLARNFFLPQQPVNEVLADQTFDLVINATPLGMLPNTELSIPKNVVEHSTCLLDLVSNPPLTPLIQLVMKMNKFHLRGDFFGERQAFLQFQIYTGLNPEVDAVKKAAEFARKNALL